MSMGARRTKGLLSSYASGQAQQKQKPSLPSGTPISIPSCLVTPKCIKKRKIKADCPLPAILGERYEGHLPYAHVIFMICVN